VSTVLWIVVGVVGAVALGAVGLFGSILLYSRKRRRAKFDPSIDLAAKQIDAADEQLLRTLLSAAPSNGAIAEGNAEAAWARGAQLLDGYRGDHDTLKLAADAFREALSYDPKYPFAWAWLAETCLLACYSQTDGFGEVYWRGGLAQAEKLADRAFELAPTNDDVIAIKAAYRRHRGYVAEAEALLAEGDPNHWRIAQVKAGCHDDRDQYVPWIEQLILAAGNGPKGRQAKLLNSLGSALSKMNKTDDAVKAFDAALQLAPEYAWAWHNRAVALFRAGRNKEALESSDKALQHGDFEAAKNLNVRLKRLAR